MTLSPTLDLCKYRFYYAAIIKGTHYLCSSKLSIRVINANFSRFISVLPLFNYKRDDTHLFK